ncbi:hypothetical protein CBER1_03423 [Cercospora berteroae]|uniref:Uncharacterized protein n=1 Tax=Cercospora berteroae TaxID=357750 RepID=A0A2S6C8C6_9PEZI|nr:hypothetical protein CBER1_03423 [Cercospora berteroae]
METFKGSNDMSRLKGKVCLVTGGASGIGLATVQHWAAAGALVTIADLRTEEKGSALAQDISDETGGNVNYVRCDVTDWDSQINAFRGAVTFGAKEELDIVATFAGTAFAAENVVDQVLRAGEPSLESKLAPPDVRNIDINLKGVYYSAWLALYYMRMKSGARNSSSIQDGINTSSLAEKSLVMVSSIAGYFDSPKTATYPASKFGVRGLFRATRARTLDIGVRCNLLAPWFVDTPLVAPIKNGMAARGIDIGKVLSFASIESCVEAATVCAVDTELHGHALAIQPEGIFDLNDDFEHGWGGDQLRPIIQRRREAGFRA